mgnify:CR=1 FL=1|tara:strand:- start:4783 stop:5034 length:252 start_codon:yes stop_codon:yes gene_type:complete
MKKGQAIFQIGKYGLQEGVIKSLKNCFKDRENIKIHVLKSAGHEKQHVKEMAEKIVSGLGNKFSYRVVGFTIFVKKGKKLRKP